MSLLCLFLLAAVVIAACSNAQDAGDPAAAVESYLSAMIVNDTAKLPQLTCPAYEAGARTEFDSFGAVGGVTLDDMDCTAGTISGDSAPVTCAGAINFTYNGESQSLDLSMNTYSSQKVDGEWKMCGYQ